MRDTKYQLINTVDESLSDQDAFQIGLSEAHKKTLSYKHLIDAASGPDVRSVVHLS